MNKNLKTVLIGSLLIMSSAAANACTACVIAQSIRDSGQSVVSSVERSAERIVAAIQGSAQTISTVQSRSAEVTADANQKTESVMEQARQDDRYKVSDACAVLASTKGNSEASRSAGSLGGGTGRGGGSGTSISGVSDNMKKALQISNGATAAPSPEIQATLAASGACSSFVNSSGNNVRSNTCSLAGFSPSASNGHPDADIRAETLFDGPQKGATAAQFKRKLTVDSDGSEKSALDAYLRNLNTPIDLRQLSKSELQTEMGRQYMAYRDSYEARMSLSEKPARSMAGNRLANSIFLPVLQQLLTSEVTGPFAKAYLDANYPKWSSKGISLDEMTNLEVERRYMNRDWHIKMANLPPEAHVKEQTTIMAHQSVLLARILERLDQSSVVSGQVAATQIRQEMMPQLIQLHAAAAK